MGERFMGLRDDELGPTKSQLLALFKRMNATGVSRIYNVPVSTVKMWCASFEIQPRRIRPDAELKEESIKELMRHTAEGRVRVMGRDRRGR